MEIVIVALLVVLIVALVVVLPRLARPAAVPAPPVTVAAPPVDMAAIVEAVKASIDVGAISQGVQGAVETKIHEAAAQALAQAGNEARKQADERLKQQATALEDQTKLLLQPFEQQMRQLSDAVGSLQATYQKEQGTVGQLANQINVLQESTTSLKNALKSPTARGSWGENQLKNILRLAGMENYCDFTEQFTGGEGERNQRPDAVISLPTGGRIAIDSKAPLSAYQRMQETDDAAQKDIELKQHAKDLRNHVKALAEKKYWEQFGHDTPDFVVMFIPGEGFVADAMKSDTSLLEDAMRQRVLIASPVNLLALLLTVSKGWQMQTLQEHANTVAAMGAQLHERVGTVLGYVQTMGNGLATTNTAYNSLVGSIEDRLLVTLRRFNELGVAPDAYDDVTKKIKMINQAPRALRAVEAESPAPELEPGGE